MEESPNTAPVKNFLKTFGREPKLIILLINHAFTKLRSYYPYHKGYVGGIAIRKSAVLRFPFEQEKREGDRLPTPNLERSPLAKTTTPQQEGSRFARNSNRTENTRQVETLDRRSTYLDENAPSILRKAQHNAY